MKQRTVRHPSFIWLLRQAIFSSRPISWINTAYPFVAGYIMTGGALNWYFVVATFYFLIPYNFLVYIVNDVYDYESDIKNPRKNSIEGSILPPQTHVSMLAIAIVVAAPPLIYLLATTTFVSAIILLTITILALTYSAPPLRLKEKPFFDSVNSSLHFAGPLLFALILTGWNQTYLPVLAAFFFWGCASHAFGAIQDIVPDRAANIGSIATTLGARKTARFSLALYLLTGACLLLAPWPSALVCLPLVLYVITVAPYYNLSDRHSQQANKGWRRFLALNQVSGFVITILLILSY